MNDGQLNSNIATVTVNITLVNVAPLASNATLNTNEDTIANGSLAATDGDTDPLIYSIVNIASQGVVTLINSSTGAYTYTPNANVTGTLDAVDVDGDKLTFSLVSNPIRVHWCVPMKVLIFILIHQIRERRVLTVLSTASVMVRRIPILQQNYSVSGSGCCTGRFCCFWR